MSRRKIQTNLLSFGEYEKWDKTSQALPELQRVTSRVEAKIDAEFGYILHIKGAKGKKIQFCIEHPPFKDANGTIEPPFEGDFFIPTNDYKFFLGDKIWEPIEDKIGTWTMITLYKGQILAEKSIEIYIDEEFDLDW